MSMRSQEHGGDSNFDESMDPLKSFDMKNDSIRNTKYIHSMGMGMTQTRLGFKTKLPELLMINRN